MTDLAARGAAQGAGLAGAEGREVVVVHIALLVVGRERVEFLRVARGAERGQGEHLRLAAREEAGAMRARAEAGLAPQRADLLERAAIGAHAVFDDARADHIFFDVVQDALEVTGLGGGHRARWGFARRRVGREDVGGQRIERRFPLGFAGLREGGGHPVAHFRAHFGDEFFFVGEFLVSTFGFAHFFRHLLLQINERLERLVAELQRLDHGVFGNFVGTALDHENGIAGASDAQVEVGIRHLLEGGVEDEFAINEAHAGGGDWPIVRGHPKGDIGDGQGRRCADDGQNVGLVNLVRRERGDDNLDIVVQVFGEERAQWAVGQA